MNRYAWLVCALLLVACGPSPTATPPSPTLPVVTAGPIPSLPPPSPTPTETPPPTTTPGSGLLTYDSDFLHQVAPGAAGLYTLNAQVGDAMRIEVAPDDAALDLRLVLVAPGGRELANVNRNGPGGPETLPEFQFPLRGAYQVRVEDVSGAGLMRVRVEFLPEAARTGWQRGLSEDSQERNEGQKHCGAGVESRAGGIRTHTRSPSADFKSAASTVPPLPHIARTDSYYTPATGSARGDGRN